jgi:inner membrane protein
MDNLTHTLFAVTLGRTRLGRAGRGTTTALVLASNAPDIDIIATVRGGASYLQWHRGPTHGLLGMVVLSAVTAAIAWRIQRALDGRPNPRDETPSASFGMLWAVSALGILCHILMDLPTSYGTRLLSPFDWHWFAADLMPIVDVYLVAALFAGLLFGETSESARRRNAAIVLVLMAANYGVRAVARHEAIGLAPRVFGPLMPPPCDPGRTDHPLLVQWPQTGTVMPSTMPKGASRCLADLAAMPTFLSPFKWRLIARLSNAYELHDVDILDTTLRRPAEAGAAPWRVTVRYPDQWTPLVKAAAAAPLAQTFLGFSRYPAARWVADPQTGVVTVRWTDMRFAGGLTQDQRAGRGNLFGAMVRIAPDGALVSEQLGQ